MNPEQLKSRTFDFALKVIQVIESMPKNKTSEVLGRQLLRSATSVGANYRSACKARSKADFISKITIVEEEADESQYWLELLMRSGVVKQEMILELLQEARELTAIFTAASKTAKRNKVNDK